MNTTDQFPLPPRGERQVGWWDTIAKYSIGLAPFIIVWVVLVVWLSNLIVSKANWSEAVDDANMQEWLEETRPYRKTLPELIREYVQLRDRDASSQPVLPGAVELKRLELEEQLRAMVEPLRAYESRLPTFPVLYSLQVNISKTPPEVIHWNSPLPRPREQNLTRLRSLSFKPLPDDTSVEVTCEYTLHAFNKLQRREEEQRQVALVAQGVLIAATLVAALFVYRFLRRELLRENHRLVQLAEAEHRERDLLETRIRRQEAERAREELDRKLLQQQLEAATFQQRADKAEKSALEIKSQLYASIGIMAGSYAHNIKNLLVRPNDLLSRCLEADGTPPTQQTMLHEVKETLGTVTERLQQILRTVRRDPSQTHYTLLDMNALLGTMVQTWQKIAQEKWKLQLSFAASDKPLSVAADESHLQQALENLLFNARDATFEMRNHLREQARLAVGDERKRLLIDAASWRGEVTLRVREQEGQAVIEVADNGIGMTDEVRQNCLKTHYSTKRDNALYEGYTAGMGLGLSFVAMVFEHHKAALLIDSTPLQGTTFRVIFPPYSAVEAA